MSKATNENKIAMMGLCMALGLPLPKFHCRTEGPPSAPIFHVSLEIELPEGPSVANASGNSRKEAESKACAVFLPRLNVLIDARRSRCGHFEEPNPVGALQEHFQRIKGKMPEYRYRTRSHIPPIWEVEVIIVTAQGQVSFKAFAQSKTEAKRRTASKALMHLNGISG